MAVGPFKIVGQDGTLSVALPLTSGISASQAGLAAGAESTIGITLNRSCSFDGTQADFLFFASAVVNAAEANVQYETEVQAPSASPQITAGINVKVRNVGSVAGAQNFRVCLIAIPVGA